LLSVKVTEAVPAATALIVNEVPLAGDTVATPVLLEAAANEPEYAFSLTATVPVWPVAVKLRAAGDATTSGVAVGEAVGEADGAGDAPVTVTMNCDEPPFWSLTVIVVVPFSNVSMVKVAPPESDATVRSDSAARVSDEL
jgi:hypothetical protein